MRRQLWIRGHLLVLILAAASLQPALADFELADSTGRRIVLKDNGTWSYVDAKEDTKDKGPAAVPVKPEPLADLQLMRRLEAPGSCLFEVMLTNNLPYEIVSLVPAFAAQRANGVVFASKLVGFSAVKPGVNVSRSMLFGGIGCQDIAKLQVLGGDRCEMGELNKFTEGRGRCLALLRVVPSELLQFEK